MSALLSAIVVLILAAITVHTVSYAVWNWREGNRAGSVFLYLICMAEIGLPLYLFFFRT